MDSILISKPACAAVGCAAETRVAACEEAQRATQYAQTCTVHGIRAMRLVNAVCWANLARCDVQLLAKHVSWRRCPPSVELQWNRTSFADWLCDDYQDVG
jgi:hypothetical protein